MKKRFFCLIFFLIIMVSCKYSTEPLIKAETHYFYISTPEEAYVQVVVQNIHGDIFKILYSDTLKIGTHVFKWTGKNEKGEYVEEGFYIISAVIYRQDSPPISFSKLIYYGRE